MKTKILIPFIFLFGIINAQHIRYAYDSKEMKNLLAGTLYIIPTGDKTFDDSLLASVKRYWKVTPYEVIAPADVDNAIKDETKYFIAPASSLEKDVMPRLIGSPLIDPEIEKIYVFHGSKSNKITKMDIAISMTECALPFSIGWCGGRLSSDGKQRLQPYFQYGATGLDYVVKNLNDNIKVVIDNKLDPIKHATGDDNPAVREDLSTSPQILKDRTLLIPEDLTKYYMPDSRLKTYKFKYKVVSLADMASLLSSANAKDYCFVPVFEGGAEIYDPVTKSIVTCQMNFKILNNDIAGQGKKKNK